MLGDAWGNEPQPTAEQSSVFSLDYARAKAREVQVVLNGLDRAYRATMDVLEVGALTPEQTAELVGALDDYDRRRGWIAAAVESGNAIAAAINAAGGRFPVLSIPPTLRALPALVAPAAIAAYVAGVAAVIVWGRQWLVGLNERLSRAQLIESTPPEQRAGLVRAMAETDAAIREVESSTLAAVAPAVRWLAIGVVAWLAYRAWSQTRGG
jgi:hypothetical protein